MKIKNLKIKILVLMFLLPILSGCGGGGGGNRDADIHITQGWTEYDSKAYFNAINEFNNALTSKPTDSQASEAYTGLGWAYLQLHNYTTAIQNFDNAEIKNAQNQDAYVGELSALVMRQQSGDYNSAVTAGETAKSLIIQTYVFSHYPNTKYTDVISLLALSYYYIENYTESRVNVNLILAKEPNNNLALLLDELLKNKGYQKG